MSCTRLTICSLALGALLLGQTACVHTPAGTSVQVALAKRAEPVHLAAVPGQPLPQSQAQPRATAAVAGTPPSHVEPDKTEQVADAFSRAEFCLGAGKDEEAISAFQEVVKIDPKFVDAWSKLATLYERTGKEQLAMDAYRKAKNIGGQHSAGAQERF